MFSYSKRAKDYNEKKARLKILRQKAAERNPDEFTYSMLSSRSKGGRKFSNRGNPILSQDAVKLLKTQDSGYLRTTLSKTRRAVEKIEQGFVLREGQTAEVLGGRACQAEAQHVVFVDSREEQKAYTPGTAAASRSNHIRLAQKSLIKHTPDDFEGESVNDVLQKIPMSRRAARREDEASKKDKLQSKLHRKEQNARRAKLAALKTRERDLVDAEYELELQRAKMSNSIGGVTKAGVKWKPRERKR